MRRYLTLFIVALLSLFVEGVCVQWLPAYAVPHLLVCVVVYLAFFDLSIAAAVFAFMLGLLADFSSGLIVGPWAGALVATYGLISLVSQRLFVHSGLVMFAAAAVASLASDIFYWLLVLEIRSANTSVLGVMFGRALLTGLVAPVLQVAISRFDARKGSSQGRLGLSTVGA